MLYHTGLPPDALAQMRRAFLCQENAEAAEKVVPARPLQNVHDHIYQGGAVFTPSEALEGLSDRLIV